MFKISLRRISLSFTFYSQGTRGLEKLSKLPKVTELVSGGVKIDPASSEITFHVLSTTTCIKIWLIPKLGLKYYIFPHLCKIDYPHLMHHCDSNSWWGLATLGSIYTFFNQTCFLWETCQWVDFFFSLLSWALHNPREGKAALLFTWLCFLQLLLLFEDVALGLLFVEDWSEHRFCHEMGPESVLLSCSREAEIW